jgi:hypothetical protein
VKFASQDHISLSEATCSQFSKDNDMAAKALQNAASVTPLMLSTAALFAEPRSKYTTSTDQEGS